MAFKYVNPGYAELTVNGGTTVNDNIVNPLNGVKYTPGGDKKVVYLPSSPIQDLWLKAQYDRATAVGYIYIRNSHKENGITFSDNKLTIQCHGTTKSFVDDVFKSATGIIIIHWHFSKTDGFIEVLVNGKMFKSDGGNVGDGIDQDHDPTVSLRIDANGTKNYWYNIILADYDISDEEIATAKLTDLTGTWDGIEAGTAKATEAGQVLSQKIDTVDLASQIKKQSSMMNITGITVAGLKMEYDNTKVNSMTGIINDGSKDVFTETKTINNFSMVCNSYQKNLSIEDISKLTCSLKAAKA